MCISPERDYANTGDAELTFNTGGVSLVGGGDYVAFLSISQYYGAYAGEVQVSQGSATIPGSSFVDYNNPGNYNELFTSPWDDTGRKPDWAIDAEFSGAAPTPEPAAIFLLLTVIASAGLVARKKRAVRP